MKIKIAFFVFLLCLIKINAFSAIQITSETDLLKLMNQVSPFNDWSADYELTTDLDMTGYTNSSVPYATKPIGNGFTEFTGAFEGNGFVIRNLNIDNGNNDFSGFFGYIGSSGTVRSLGIENATVAARGSHIGVFVGVNQGFITNCYAAGSATGAASVSIFLGIGGFAGSNIYGIITNCYATSSAMGIPIGNATFYHTSIGGFVGYNNYGTISNCFASGNASGYLNIGGFAGRNIYGIITNCYATGNASGDRGVGGFAGYCANGSISYCYSLGIPSATTMLNEGGFIGNSLGSPTYNCNFWNIETSGTEDAVGNMDPDPTGVTGLTDQQFSDPSNFSCFNFGNDWIMPSSLRYGDKFGNYPILRSILFTFFIPTLTEWTVIIFVGLLAGVGGWFVWRKLV